MKRFAIVALCAVLALGLVACGKDAAKTEGDSGPQPSDHASDTATAEQVTFLYFGSPG